MERISINDLEDFHVEYKEGIEGIPNKEEVLSEIINSNDPRMIELLNLWNKHHKRTNMSLVFIIYKTKDQRHTLCHLTIYKDEGKVNLGVTHHSAYTFSTACFSALLFLQRIIVKLLQDPFFDTISFSLGAIREESKEIDLIGIKYNHVKRFFNWYERNCVRWKLNLQIFFGLDNKSTVCLYNNGEIIFKEENGIFEDQILNMVEFFNKEALYKLITLNLDEIDEYTEKIIVRNLLEQSYKEFNKVIESSNTESLSPSLINIKENIKTYLDIFPSSRI